MTVVRRAHVTVVHRFLLLIHLRVHGELISSHTVVSEPIKYSTTSSITPSEDCFESGASAASRAVDFGVEVVGLTHIEKFHLSMGCLGMILACVSSNGETCGFLRLCQRLYG